MTDAALRELESLAKIVDTEGWSAERGAQIAALLSPTGKPFVFGKASWHSVTAAMLAATRGAHGWDYFARRDCRCVPCRRRRATIIVRDSWKRWKRENDHRDVRKTLLAKSTSGGCRVCGEVVARGERNRPRSWHDGRNGEPDCLEIFFVATKPAYDGRAWPYWVKRCGGLCERCHGEGPFQVDHVVPLVDGGSPWPENLQLLCETCHGAKTAAENSARMRARARVLDDARMARDDRPRLFA